MSDNSFPPRVVYVTKTECEVELPNEFLTLFCRRCPDGTAMCTSWENWNTDSPARPSPGGREEAEKLAAEKMKIERGELRA